MLDISKHAKLWERLAKSMTCGYCGGSTTVDSEFTCSTCGRMLCAACGERWGRCVQHQIKCCGQTMNGSCRHNMSCGVCGNGWGSSPDPCNKGEEG